MKILSALFTALVVVGFASVASAACSGYKAPAESAESQSIVTPPSVGS